MRLFTGIALPGAIADNLESLLAGLRPAARIRWSPIRNLHITTKFIGEWPDERLEEMKGALAGVSSPAPFDIQVRGFGWFPNPHSPRILWVGVHAPEALRDLARRTDEATAKLGVVAEKKAYSPHLTLARIGDPVPLLDLKRTIAGLPSDEFGTFRVEAWHLYLSRPGPSGSVYTRLADYSLNAK